MVNKTSFISSALVFSLFVSAVPSYAMMSRCEIEDQSATNVTIRCNTMTRCSYTCPTNSEWDAWKSNLVYAVGGVFFGLVIPKLPALYNYVHFKWRQYWAPSVPVAGPDPSASNITAVDVSSGDVSGQVTERESVSE